MDCQKGKKEKNLQVLELSFSCFKPFGVWGVTEGPLQLQNLVDCNYDLESRCYNKSTLGSMHYLCKFLNIHHNSGKLGSWYKNNSGAVTKFVGIPMNKPPEDLKHHCIDQPKWLKWLLAHRYKKPQSQRVGESEKKLETMCFKPTTNNIVRIKNCILNYRSQLI